MKIWEWQGKDVTLILVKDPSPQRLKMGNLAEKAYKTAVDLIMRLEEKNRTNVR
jgi:hypothetical protein